MNHAQNRSYATLFSEEYIDSYSLYYNVLGWFRQLQGKVFGNDQDDASLSISNICHSADSEDNNPEMKPLNVQLIEVPGGDYTETLRKFGLILTQN